MLLSHCSRPLKCSPPAPSATALFVLLSLAASALGQTQPAAPLSPLPLADLTRSILQASIPREYDGQKNWGTTKQVTVGVRLRREGLRLETERRRKAVNDGLWTKYQARVPDGRQLELSVADVRQNDRGELAFVLLATAPIAGHADVMRWNRGIRLLSIGVDCEATVRLRLEGTVALKIDGGIVTPTVAVEPRITAAKLELVDFRLVRLGGVERHIAHEIGEALEGPIRGRLAKEEPKLVDRLNRSIAKRRDDLRVSGDEFLKEQWDRMRKWLETQPAQPVKAR
ncbi:MAG: hypothetical protein WD468_07960 [Pirellulales bacterium]